MLMCLREVQPAALFANYIIYSGLFAAVSEETRFPLLDWNDVVVRTHSVPIYVVNGILLCVLHLYSLFHHVERLRCGPAACSSHRRDPVIQNIRSRTG